MKADPVHSTLYSLALKGNAEDGDKERIDEALVTHDGVQLVPIWDGELRDALADFGRAVLIFDICLAGGMKKDLDASGRVIAMASDERGLSYEGPYRSGLS